VRWRFIWHREIVVARFVAACDHLIMAISRAQETTAVVEHGISRAAR
jgi:hypothetical protein